MNLIDKLSAAKSSKLAYYAGRYLTLMIPNAIYSMRRRHLLKRFDKMPTQQQEYIMDRVNYYCKLNNVEGFTSRSDISTLGEHKLGNRKARGCSSVYFFDSYEYVRALPNHLKWAYVFGDVDYVTPLPAITKSRPISDDNHNSVIFKLNKLRHFINSNDRKRFDEKPKAAIFRGHIDGKRCRLEFMRKIYGSSLCDSGAVSSTAQIPSEWHRPKMTIAEQLCYKFIVSLEGNDVASNLKWIMSSNSVAVMPRPRFETWFMEGRLIPNVHYIEVASDYSDFEERIQYYIDNPDEAKKIAQNANDYWAQFQNREREEIISHLVLREYFSRTGQMV